MEDVYSAGTIEYCAAAPIKPKSITEIIRSNIKLLIELVPAVILSFYVTCTLIKDFIKKIPPKNISGQLALVTGGGNGLGREMCIQLAKEGCNVAIVDIDIKAAEKTAEEIKLFNIQAKAYKVDITKIIEIEKCRELIEEDLGFVDILINNAGLMPTISLCEGRPEDIQQVLNVNISSHFWTLRVFLEGMISRRRGHIVGIASMAGYEPFGNIVYCTSKFAVRGLMKTLYEVLRNDKLEKEIFTTTVYPYFLNTRKDLIDNLSEMEIYKKFPPLSPKYAAKQIILGLKKNKESVYIPLSAYIQHLFLAMLPLQVRYIFKGIVLGKK